MRTFSTLLDALIAAPADRRPAIEQLIRDTFGATKAVLALDMSGFTLSTRRDGIVAHLCQIRRMHRLTEPIVREHGGQTVKCVADNLMAVFDDPARAVEAAVAMNRAATAGSGLAFSIGIDFGDILLIEGEDCFGDTVNMAYKLGEDVARPGEVLVTQRIRERLPADARLQEMTLSVSGVEIMAYAVGYDPA